MRSGRAMASVYREPCCIARPDPGARLPASTRLGVMRAQGFGKLFQTRPRHREPNLRGTDPSIENRSNGAARGRKQTTSVMLCYARSTVSSWLCGIANENDGAYCMNV